MKGYRKDVRTSREVVVYGDTADLHHRNILVRWSKTIGYPGIEKRRYGRSPGPATMSGIAEG